MSVSSILFTLSPIPSKSSSKSSPKAIILAVLRVGNDISLCLSLRIYLVLYFICGLVEDPFIHIATTHHIFFVVLEVSMLKMDGHIFQHHLLKKLSFPTELPLHFCQKSIDHIYGDLFVDSLFVSLTYLS